MRKIDDNSIDAGITSPVYNKLGLMKGKKQKGGDWDGYITYDKFDAPLRGRLDSKGTVG